MNDDLTTRLEIIGAELRQAGEQMRQRDAAIAALQAELAQLGPLRPLLAQRPVAAWLLTQASPGVEFIQAGDLYEPRLLELDGWGSVLVVALPEPAGDDLAGLKTLIATPGYCRICGCSQENACTDDDDQPCHWVEPDLCSRCAAGARA